MTQNIREPTIEGRGEASVEVMFVVEGNDINVPDLENVVGCAASQVWTKSPKIEAPSIPGMCWILRLRSDPCDYLDSAVRKAIEHFVKNRVCLTAYCSRHGLRVAVIAKISGDSEWIVPEIESATIKDLALINAALIVKTLL